MEQKFEGEPKATLSLEGRRVTRTDVTNDWGLLLQWEVRKNGQLVATANARTSAAYEHPDTTAGNYEIVLQMWKYIDYRKKPDGEFVASRFIEVSNKVRYTGMVPAGARVCLYQTIQAAEPENNGGIRLISECRVLADGLRAFLREIGEAAAQEARRLQMELEQVGESIARAAGPAGPSPHPDYRRRHRVKE